MPERSLAATRAYNAIRTRVTDGRYPTGQLLDADNVAMDLDLPAGVIREAFLRLQSENVLRIYPSRGALVMPLDLEEARAVMEARLLLEFFALDSVAAHGRPRVRELGRELASGLHEVDTSDEALDLGRVFHTRLVAAAGNPVVARMHSALWDRSLHIAAASTIGVGYPQNDVAEHFAIAEAMIRGRGEEARGLLHQHVSAILRRIGVGEDFALPRPAGH